MLTPGLKVVTLHDSGSTDWCEPRTNVQWGVMGVIQKISNSHGLIALVKHPDNTESWYEEQELQVIEQSCRDLKEAF